MNEGCKLQLILFSEKRYSYTLDFTAVPKLWRRVSGQAAAPLTGIQIQSACYITRCSLQAVVVEPSSLVYRLDRYTALPVAPSMVLNHHYIQELLLLLLL